MTYLSLENVSKAFGEKILLNNVTFSIEKGQKVAIVAKNGSGKSTLLKIIAGLEASDNGQVIKKSGLKIGFLDQNPSFSPDHTIIESLFDSTSDVIQAVKNYEVCLLTPEDTDKMQDAFDQMEKYDGWDFDVKLNDILSNLNLTNIDHKVYQLSGGQKKRLAIAKFLLDSPDLLMLDEPTNHIDIEMIDWLESYLSKSDITLIMVTHDRYFLDKVCSSILELENGTIHKHNGNYSYYLQKKNEREQNELNTAEKTAQLLKRESAWINKMPQGRGSKSTARTSNFYEDKQKNNNIKSYIRERSKKVKLDVKESYIGKKVLELSNIDKAFGEKIILNKFSYIFKQKEKLGIIGHNGVGKSTFLNLIMQLEDPDSGYITAGETIKFGYYTQNGINVSDEKTILDTVKDVAEYTVLSDGSRATASQLLERFLFPMNLQHKRVSTLSGGEKRRLYLLTVILSNPNFLILDEPTNDLDLVTINILQEFLVNFKGCLIIVSHDRYFMDLIVDHLFIFEGNGVIQDFPGNYTDYRDRFKISRPVVVKVNKEDSSKLKEKKIILHKLENEIKNLENKNEKLTESLNNITNLEDIRKVSEDIQKILLQIDEKTKEWLIISE